MVSPGRDHGLSCVDAEDRSELGLGSCAQIIFAEADGVARAACAACTVAVGALPGGVAGFEPPQLVMLSMQTNTTNTKNVLC